MLIELIICDLVPLRERPKFLSLVAVVFAIGTSMGPFIGGALVQHANWRWVFYMNLPIGGSALVLLILFLHVKHKKTTFAESVKRFDFLGSFLLITSTVTILFALTYAGSQYRWSSWHVVAPLVIGLVGLAGFHVYEASGIVNNPLTPPHLFANRTSAIAFFVTFIHAMLFVWVIYFLPVYFQAVRGSSATRSGVQLLPTVTAMIPFAALGAQFIERTGRYKPSHLAGLTLMAVGLGSFALLKLNSSTAMWAGLQVLQTAGAGFLATALLPAVQADLSDKDNAASTGTWSYIRSYGAIWGITIPVSIFNNQFDKHLDVISDPAVRSVLAGGNAFAHGSREFLGLLPESVRLEVISVFLRSLRMTWIVGAVICAVTCVVVLAEKELTLRTQLDSEYGFDERKKADEDPETRVKSSINGENQDDAKKEHVAVVLPIPPVPAVS